MIILGWSKLPVDKKILNYFQSRKRLYNHKCPFVRSSVRQSVCLSVRYQNPQTAYNQSFHLTNNHTTTSQHHQTLHHTQHHTHHQTHHHTHTHTHTNQHPHNHASGATFKPSHTTSHIPSYTTSHTLQLTD